MKIGVISDTHGRFDKQFREFFEPCDEIWHSGDFGGGFSTAGEIAGFKPLVGVVGNCDERGLVHEYPLYRYFQREGNNILMTHIGGYPGRYDIQAYQLIMRYKPDIFVCGHSHILRVMQDDRIISAKGKGMIVINPGAAGLQGIHVVRTAVRFNLGGDGISDLEVINVDR